jgi:lipopolysaccharide transport system ATP-binding protein
LVLKSAGISIESASVIFPVAKGLVDFLGPRDGHEKTGGSFQGGEGKQMVVEALSDISLSLVPGDRIGVIGHNGSGKSTFLRLLSGVYPPSKGSIKVSGSISSLIDINMGMHPEATGVENIFVRAAILGMSKKETHEYLSAIVEFSDIGQFVNLPLKSLSSGMQMRLAFSVSTVLSKDILIMDEWLSVGDAEFRKKAEVRLKEVVSRSQILVVATHSQDLIELVCNKVLWLEHGRVKMFDEVSEVLPKYFG